MADKVKRWEDLPLDGKPVTGTWKLLSDHQIAYRSQSRDETFRFTAPLVAAEPDALVAAVTIDQDDQTVVTRTLKIAGRWKTDGRNRLVFEAERSGGRKNQLTFKGTWKVNEAHQIVYSYRSEALKTRQKTEQSLTFSGFWELTDRHHLTYVLDADADSAFRFRGAFQTPSILAKKGEIRFRIGAEVEGRLRGRRLGRSVRPAQRPQVVALFGSWKIGRDWALTFELDRPGAANRVMRFGGEVVFADTRRIEVNLKTERGKPLGVEVAFTRDLGRDRGELFARLERGLRESRIEAGGRLRF